MAKNGANKGRKPTRKHRKVQQKPTVDIKGRMLNVTLQQRIYACRLRKEGKEACQISAALHEKYGLELPSSSLSSLYNAKAMKTCEDLIRRGSLMHTVEYQFNRKQRPTMMTDLDYIFILEHRSSG